MGHFSVNGIHLPYPSKIHPEPLADAPGHSPQPARIGISPLTQQQLEPETSDLQGGLGAVPWQNAVKHGGKWGNHVERFHQRVGKKWWFNWLNRQEWDRRNRHGYTKKFCPWNSCRNCYGTWTAGFRNKNYGFTGKQTYPLQVKFSRGQSDGDPALRLLDTQPSPSLKHL